MFRRVPLLLILLPAVALASAPRPDTVVAADGTGQYRSVQEAISAAPMRTGNADPRWIIFVKAGTYQERIYVQRERGNILVTGEDAAKTIITYDLQANLPGPDGKPIGTYRTPTLQVDGDGMIWENLTIANGAGAPGPRPGAPAVTQAVALRVDGDRVIFRNCRFLGWQDTILVNRGRQYFSDCYIEGSVDFIFGGATAYFDRCHIHCLADGFITAASTPEGQPDGFVFADCSITGAAGVKTYLGRPWRIYARTMFLRTEMSAVVRPEGWHNWNKPEAEKTTHYSEFSSTDPGSKPTGRVAWARKPGTGDSAKFTPAAVLAGADGWNPVPGPTLHLAGDSTMADKPDMDYPERGWGQLLREFVRPPWHLVNYAANGRSTKSFRTLGHWQLLLDQLKPGDWVVIEFGHNDAKKEDPLRYADPQTDYPANLRQFVREVRARGAQPILATSVVRRDWDESGRLKDTHGPYLTAVRTVAAEEKVPLLDMEKLTRELVTGLGPEASKKLFMIFAPGEHPRIPEGKTDNTHAVEAGARRQAELAIRELRRLQLPVAAAFGEAEPVAGTYSNPVLSADYSDPDAVRVGEDYWLVSSSFSHVPGLPLLHSRDLVNWELAGHALPRLVPEDVFSVPQHGKGVWAPAIRFHAGKYWIYYPDPDFGIYVVTAADPRGPWSAPVLVKAGRGLIDPCPLWDDDGKVWLIHAWARSRAGINNIVSLQRLSDDGQKVTGETRVIIDGNKLAGYGTLEGPKFYKRNGWYYIFAPAGGVAEGWQSVFRSKNIVGPYADRIVMDQGKTPVNGPHQGALVDTPGGEWWFLHFQDKGAYGRVVHLQPVVWHDDWPVIGDDPDGDGKGQPFLVHQKPTLPLQPAATPATSDEFDSPGLGLQWQWQANPQAAWYSLTARPGHLRLFAQPEPHPETLYDAPYLLMQKFPAEEFTATTKVEFKPAGEAQVAGLMVFGYDYAWIGVGNVAGDLQLLYAVVKDSASKPMGQETRLPKITGPAWLRVTVRAGGICQFAYSLDGTAFTTVPGTFKATVGRWVGAKVGLFASAPRISISLAKGYADFDWFHVEVSPR